MSYDNCNIDNNIIENENIFSLIGKFKKINNNNNNLINDKYKEIKLIIFKVNDRIKQSFNRIRLILKLTNENQQLAHENRQLTNENQQLKLKLEQIKNQNTTTNN
ncbi:hypothetical protein ACTFIW_000565 [Dictyostelium discoideum]